MRFPMHLSMSTITDEHHPLPHPHPHSHPHAHPVPHPHPRYDRHDTMAACDYGVDFHPGSGGGGGGGSMGAGERPGYAVSEISSSDYASTTQRGSHQGVLILVTFLIELFIIIFVIVIEYFLRWTDVFPLRRQKFSCNDVSIMCTSRDKQFMADFAFDAIVPDAAVYALSFCVPPLVVLIGEIGLCTLSEGQQKSIRLRNRHCSVPYIFRRLLRFLGVYVFGAFAVMVVADVTKIMIGRLRPDFLETCQVNTTLCSQSTALDDTACLNTDTLTLREARTSFPSFNSALTSYAAVYISVYIHGAMRSQSVRVLRPFLALVFLLLTLLGGLSEYTTCVSHWTDVLAGLVLGGALSVYLTVGVLNKFHEHLSHTELMHMMRTLVADAYLSYEDKCQLTRPPDHMSTSLHIPRAHMTPSRLAQFTEAAKQQQRRRPFNTFQRDLSQSVEFHRRHHSYLNAGGSSHM